jgi:hypothetical protein
MISTSPNTQYIHTRESNLIIPQISRNGLIIPWIKSDIDGLMFWIVRLFHRRAITVRSEIDGRGGWNVSLTSFVFVDCKGEDCDCGDTSNDGTCDNGRYVGGASRGGGLIRRRGIRCG